MNGRSETGEARSVLTLPLCGPPGSGCYTAEVLPVPRSRHRPFASLIAASRGLLTNALRPTCMLCAGDAYAGALCAPCMNGLAELPQGCPVCALPSPPGIRCGACLRRPPHFDRTVAATSYAFPLDRLLQAYKYGGALPLAASFARLVADAVQRSGSTRPDVLVPVPLARSRLQTRGFNQAHEIARRVGRALDIACRPALVQRQRSTAVQADLDLNERARNVRGAFAAASDLSGAHVALIDDVMTTGATLDEVARVLKAAGAARIECWVVARALLDP